MTVEFRVSVFAAAARGGRGSFIKEMMGTNVERSGGQPAPVQVHLLGATTVTVADTTYDLSGRRAGDLVAYLAAMAPLPVHPVDIGRVLWPDARLTQRRTNLRHLWFQLREQYPEIVAALHRDVQSGALSFRTPPTVDIKEWIRRAPPLSTPAEVECWLEEYGEGPAMGPAGGVEPWRIEVETLYRSRAHTLVAWYAARRAVRDAERILARQVRVGLAADEDRLHLVRLAAMGRQGVGLDAAAQTLRQSDGSLSGAMREEIARLRVVVNSWESAPPFVDRMREWERLEHARWRAESGQSVCVFIQGPTGIGKSALLVQWRRWLDVLTVPVVGSPPPGPTDFNWQAWQEDLLMKTSGSVTVVPRSSRPRETASQEPAPLPDRWGRYQALARACATHTTSVLIWDNLPVMAEDAWRWLAYLLRSPHRTGLLVCVATGDDPEHVRQRRRLFDTLRGATACEVLALTPLASDHARDLVAQLLPRSTEGVEPLLQWTAGHPLAIVEGARLLAAGGELPAGALPIMIQHHLKALTPPLRRGVIAMSVLGRRMPPPFWRDVAGITDTRLQHLIQTGLVSAEASGRLGLAHDAIVTAALHTLTPATHRRWALRLAMALSHDGEETDPALVAGLYESAEHAIEARAWWHRAAENARRGLNLSAAQHAYERLLVLDHGPSRLIWRVALAHVLEERGERMDALAHFRTACMEALAVGDFTRLPEARAGFARQLVVQGDFDTAEALLAENLAYYREAADQPAAARTLVQLAELATRCGALDTARMRAEEGRTVANAVGDAKITAEAEGQLGYVAWERGYYADAVRYWRQAEGHALTAGDALTAMRALGDIGVALLESGHLAPAVEYQWQKATLARQYGLMEDLALALGNLGVAYQDVGQWIESRHCLEAASRLALTQDDQRVVTILTNNLAYTMGQEGDTATAERLWRAAVGLAEAIPLPRSAAQFLLHWADLLWERGAYARVPPLLRRAWHSLPTSPEWDRVRWRALAVRIQWARGALASKDGRHRLLGAWDRWQRPESWALLRYVLWEVTQDPDDRRRATEAVNSVLTQHPHHVWQRYAMRLTGCMPSLPHLAPPPAWVETLGEPRQSLEDELLAFTARYPVVRGEDQVLGIRGSSDRLP